MQVTLLVVGLIVGFALGIGAGAFLWRGGREHRQAEERAPARRPRSYEPSTPPQHHPTPRPRPVTAMRHATSSPSDLERPRPAPTVAPPVEAPPLPREPEPEPVVAETPIRMPEPLAATPHPGLRRDPEPEPEPEAFDKYEYRPTPRREQGPVSVEDPRHADRHLLQELLEANRRLTADAELRLRRERDAAGAEPARREQPPTRPAVSSPAPDDLLARHRMLEEDSRRMRRQD